MGGRPFRTPAMQKTYDDFVAAGGLAGECALCAAVSVKEFGLWRIVQNKFPYDRVSSVHHMIIPKRHANETGLTGEEWAEYQKIKEEYLQGEYDFFIEASNKKKTIPQHFHIHLIVATETV